MRRVLAVLLTFGVIAISAPADPLSARIFGDLDSDTSLCANIGSGYDRPSVYPAGWPQVDYLQLTSPPSVGKTNLEGGQTNWHCRTDTGLTTGGRSCAGSNGTTVCAGGTWSMTFPVGSPVYIGKQDIQLNVDNGGYPKSLTRVEWDYDGNGTYETVDNGPWLTAYGTTDSNNCSGCPYTTRTTKASYFEGTTSFSTLGDHTVNLRVTYSDGSTSSSAGIFTSTADTANASVAYATHSLTGKPYTLSAANSTAASGHIAKYEWDLDGNGTFEVDGGNTATHTTVPPAAGIWTPAVRVTSRGGAQDTESFRVDVRPSPPDGDAGMSINDGSPFTNTKNVLLNLVWPEYATQVKVSNDGGFAASRTRTFDVAETVEWALDDSLTGVFSKVVYVKFVGFAPGGTDPSTRLYQDDIVLDTTAPAVTSVQATGSTGSGAVTLQSAGRVDVNFPAAGKAWRTARLSVKARDNLSGVKEIQFNTKASASKAKLTKFRNSLKVRTSARTLWMRVRDGAGNFSRWRQVRIP